MPPPSPAPFVTLSMAKECATAPWHRAKFCVGPNHTDPTRTVSVFIGFEHRRRTVVATDVGPTASIAQEHANLECIGLLHAADMGFTVVESVERGVAA